MSVERFITEVEERGLLSGRLVAKLRDKVAQSDRPFTAKALAKFLVDKNHLTQRQATDVLGSLLRTGVDVDASPAPQTAGLELIDEGEPPPASPTEDTVVPHKLPQLTADEADDDEDSSIFEPSLSDIQKSQPAATESSPELGLAPTSDVAIAESLSPTAPPATPVEGEEGAAAELDLPALKTEPTRKKSRRRLAEDKPAAEEPLDSPAAEAAVLDEKKKRPNKRKKASKRANEWDSPLILLGGGGLALLLLIGGLTFYLLRTDTANELLARAEQNVKAGSHTQAIADYEEFLERFPRHLERGPVQVKLAMVRLRRATEAGNYESALELARNDLREIESEEQFGKHAHAELAGLLPRIALGLAKQAEAANDPEEVQRLVELSMAALGLANNTKYVPKSLRYDADFDEVQVLLARIERQQRSQHDLQQAIDTMEQSIAAGNTRAAYAAHVEFIKKHPELAGEARLHETVLKTTAAEQAAIRYVNDEQPAETAEHPTPWVASLAVANRRVKPAGGTADGAGKGTTCVRVEGAVYGFDVATGRLLWRRHVGHARAAWPIQLESDVLVADTARHELLRLDAATGRLVWRAAVGEPFAAPLVVGKRAFLAAPSGRLYIIDLPSGTRTGYLEFAQPLRVTPAVDRSAQRLYLPGDHSSLYTISLADLSCLGVHYLGHAEGSVTTSPVAAMNKLVVLENDGVATSRLRLLSFGNDGAVARQTLERRVTGLATAPPFVAGRRLVVLTDRGQIDVYEVGTAEGDEALTLVATRPATKSQPLVRHAALAERNVWLGDTQLTKLSIVPTGNRLPVEPIENDFVGATFDHPLLLFGNTLIHVHRPKGRAGVVVAATDTRQGRTLWQTDIALPPAGPPVVDQPSKALTAANAAGQLFRFDESAIRARVVDEPLPVAAGGSPAASPTGEPPVTTAVDLGNGRAAFGAAGADRLLLYNPALGDRPARWIKLESPLACAPMRLGDGIIAPLQVGQVFYLSADDGTRLATPFQPLLQPRTTWNYRQAGAIDHEASRFVITDGREKIYLIALVDEPQSHLQAVAEANVGPFPINSPVVVLGDTALAVGGDSHLLRFRLPSLQPAGETNMPAPVVAGPFPAGDAVLLLTADGQLFAVSGSGDTLWQAELEQGDLAGEPLIENNAVLLAYRNGTLERRSLSDGELLAAKDVEHPLAAGPVRFLQRLVLTAHDGTLLVADAP